MATGLDTATVTRLIRGGETLTVEFKGETRAALPDREIYETVVCFANADGGVLLIGIEDDGTITGARPRHGTTTEPTRLQAAIFNNTSPPINTRIGVHTVDGKAVVGVEVDRYPEICATRDGRSLRRVVGVDGPQCVPFLPHEHATRRSDLGLVDYTAQAVDGADWSDLDPLELERLRQLVARRRGDGVLLGLNDRELVQALRLVETRAERLVPNVAGMLLLGREVALRQAVPSHEVAVQVLQVRGEVLVNDWFTSPLLRTLEAVEDRFNARYEEDEVQVGMLRLPIPVYSREAFREAVNNAVQHRDYTRLGAVHVQFQPDHLFISNPGGFLEGITIDNLLVHEPRPRNPRLTEAMRRTGLVETTGRGVDKIFLGQLVYGRSLPDYSQSSRDAVRLVIQGGAGSRAFAAFVAEQDSAGAPLGLSELLVLDHLQRERRVDAATIGHLIQRGDADARAVLERLVERGLIEARGERRSRVYHLSASLYRKLGQPASYVRAHGFEPLQQESMVLQYVRAHGRITRRDVMDLCNLGSDEASRLLRRLAARRALRLHGQRRGAFYTLP